MDNKPKHVINIEAVIAETKASITELKELHKINSSLKVLLEKTCYSGNGLENYRQQKEAAELAIENRQIIANIESKQNYLNKWTEHATKNK